VSAAAPPPLTEQALAPSGKAEFEIGPINETRSDDGRELFVEGTIRNTGSLESRYVTVHVDGLDAAGATVARAEVLPTPQTIPPGTAASYVARLPNNPAIRTFHVEAVGR